MDRAEASRDALACRRRVADPTLNPSLSMKIPLLFAILTTWLLRGAAVPAEEKANPQRVPTTLGIDGTRFTLNDSATFLLGISYYGALGASEEFIRRDLDDMKRLGFHWLRVWASWGAFDHDVSAVDE